MHRIYYLMVAFFIIFLVCSDASATHEPPPESIPGISTDATPDLSKLKEVGGMKAVYVWKSALERITLAYVQSYKYYGLEGESALAVFLIRHENPVLYAWHAPAGGRWLTCAAFKGGRIYCDEVGVIEISLGNKVKVTEDNNLVSFGLGIINIKTRKVIEYRSFTKK